MWLSDFFVPEVRSDLKHHCGGNADIPFIGRNWSYAVAFKIILKDDAALWRVYGRDR